MSYLVTRDAIESSGPGEVLARPSLDRKQGLWAALGMGTLCTLCPALSLGPPLSVLCTLICSRICDRVGVLLSCGLRRLKRDTQMHPDLEVILAMGPILCVCGWVQGSGGARYRGDVSRTREKPQDRAERMGNFFLGEKKILLFWGKQKPPQALTGSLLMGHGPSPDPSSPVNTGSAGRRFQAVVAPHPHRSRQAWAGESLLARSPAPPNSCLSWSRGGSRPGCLMGLLTCRFRAACSVQGAGLHTGYRT